MFGPPGYAYVYAIHRYHCLNVVTEGEGIASAVLLRAVEPLQSIKAMAARRKQTRYADLTSGPGKLCQAFDIDRALDQWLLTEGQRLWLAAPLAETDVDVVATPRIGVTSAQALPLRFCDAASACLEPSGAAVGVKNCGGEIVVAMLCCLLIDASSYMSRW